MYPVFETIKIINGELQQLEYHLRRMNNTAMNLWGLSCNYTHLERAIGVLPEHGLWKCRVEYDKEFLHTECLPYSIQPLDKLILVEDKTLHYPYKYTDRNMLDKYKPRLPLGTDILFTRKGLLTDSLYANVILWNGTEWHTPSTPLLKGTKRQSLLDKGILIEKPITIRDISHYEQISLISAMLEPMERSTSTQNIKPL